jgi:hypothetical protein
VAGNILLLVAQQSLYLLALHKAENYHCVGCRKQGTRCVAAYAFLTF